MKVINVTTNYISKFALREAPTTPTINNLE